MAEPWFTSAQLRDAAGAKQAIDEGRMDLATRVACREVRGLCGPVFPAETVTDRVRVRVPNDEVPLKARPASLVSVATRAGVTLDATTFDFDGQVLFRKDGDLICADLVVTYSAGFDTAEEIPDDLVAMAGVIGSQYLRVTKRFRTDGDETSQTGFLVPSSALDIGRDFLLAERFTDG